MKETVSGSRTLRLDGYLTNIQEAIHNVLGPATQLWASTVEVEVPEYKGACEAEFDKIEAIS